MNERSVCLVLLDNIEEHGWSIVLCRRAGWLCLRTERLESMVKKGEERRKSQRKLQSHDVVCERCDLQDRSRHFDVQLVLTLVYETTVV